MSSVNLQLLKGVNGFSELGRCSKSVENPGITNMTDMNQDHFVLTCSWMKNAMLGNFDFENCLWCI
jgi:hypothetical protein